jgi:hypothetical protein
MRRKAFKLAPESTHSDAHLRLKADSLLARGFDRLFSMFQINVHGTSLAGTNNVAGEIRP